MEKEKWEEICFYLSDNVKKGISEDSFEMNVIQALRVLNWKEFLGDFDIRPSFQIGASNRITPDFVIKNNDGKNLFVIEIKQPDLQLKSTFQKQLFSYMRQLKLEYGVLIGNSIQIFYDGNLKNQEEPILIESIKFDKEDVKGFEFVKLFDKPSFKIELLDKFTLNSLKKINRKKSRAILKEKILSDNYKEVIFSLIKQDLISDYDGELVDSIFNEISLKLKDNLFEEQKFINANNQFFSKRKTKFGVIKSIQELIEESPKTKDEILNNLIKLFPERNPDGMKITISAQLGTNKRPFRIEKEKGVEVLVDFNSKGERTYFISKVLDLNQVELNKLYKRIPKWFSNPNQINSQILIKFLELNEKQNEVHFEDLEVRCKNINSFNNNFTQMKSFGERNHGKVFEVFDSLIVLWQPINEFILSEYEKYKNH